MDINGAFKATFKTLFGECNLELDDLKDYLTLYLPPMRVAKSSLSGKTVFLSSENYPETARFIAHDEVDFAEKAGKKKLDINKVKDLDSLIEAAQEEFAYAGNKVFGNSQYVEGSDDVFDSFHVKNSNFVYSSKYVAYSSHVRDNSEYVFGSAYFLRSQHVIRTMAADSVTRCFETYLCTNSADLFFCYGCLGCSNLMFSFNQRTKRNMIGNLELPKDKYVELRAKLASESREYIEKNKRFCSMFGLPRPKAVPKIDLAAKPARTLEGGMKEIDVAFRATCKMVLGKDIGPMEKYADYLSSKISTVQEARTPFGNVSPATDIFFFKYIPKERGVLFWEAEQLAKMHIAQEDAGDMDLDGIMDSMRDLAYFRRDLIEGANHNINDTVIAWNASNTYRMVDATFTKNCAHSTMALNSEYIFGSFRAVHSKFCLRCHNCVNVSTSFEMDSCTNCTGAMFCHNCEALDNCMFCFNTRSKRYAVANVEVGRERYLEIRKRILDEIVKRLESKGTPGFDVYCVGGKNRMRAP